MRLGQPNIPCLSEPTPADALRMSPLDAGPRGILLSEFFGRLPVPRGLQRLLVLARLESQEAGLLLGPCTLGSVETRRAIFASKAHLPRHPILRIGVREP